MRYFANFCANHDTRLMEPFEDTCKSRIIRDIRETAEGNRTEGNECSWEVWDEDDNTIASGGCDRTGRRYRTN